ncbi:hypothetical protein GCM10009790_26350 [Georgenia ruanii]
MKVTIEAKATAHTAAGWRNRGVEAGVAGAAAGEAPAAGAAVGAGDWARVMSLSESRRGKLGVRGGGSRYLRWDGRAPHRWVGDAEIVHE